MTLVRNSDEGAFSEIYHRYWNKMFAVAYHRLNDESEAEEIVQNIFVSLWKRREDLVVTHTLGTYLSVAVKYQVITRLAKLRQRRKCEDQLIRSAVECEAPTADWLSEKEIKAQIELCVNELPEKCRIVFLMSREEGLSNARIAQALNINLKTVEGHITKALQRLRTSLRPFLSLLLLLLFHQ